MLKVPSLSQLHRYRKVKNSWGDTWGQEGYILLERADAEEGDGGECGLLVEATYPILEPIPSPEAADEASLKMMAVERPLGFESSASANDCGGGTSDVVFDDGEEEGAGGPREGWVRVLGLGVSICVKSVSAVLV